MVKPATDIYTNINALQQLKLSADDFSLANKSVIKNSLTGQHHSRWQGQGHSFEALRHYSPGDDIRAMDWKVTRRTGKPHIKVYSEERGKQFLLAVDQRANMFFGSQGKMKSVISAELAAFIAWQVTKDNDCIGGVIFNDDEITTLPAKKSQQHVMQLLQQIVKKNQQLSIESVRRKKNTSTVSFHQMLKKALQQCQSNTVLILLTDGDGLGDGLSKENDKLIKKILQNNDVIFCEIVDPLALSLPKVAQTVVSDGQWQIQFDSNNVVIQEKFLASVQQKRSQAQQMAKKYHFPLLTINTVSPIEQQLSNLLNRGQAIDS